MERPDRIDLILAAIDATLEQPPIPLREALYQAVFVRQTMTQDDARECYAAYMRNFTEDV